MRKEYLKFILNMLVMLCNDDRTHLGGLVNVLQTMFLYCQCYKCISKLYPRYSMRTRYPTSNFPIYLPSMVLFSCKSCITKLPDTHSKDAIKSISCISKSPIFIHSKADKFKSSKLSILVLWITYTSFIKFFQFQPNIAKWS